jgi:2-oxoacid:acceptor oxidoreductase gamma subunit (pyruvate/2-ketoisovalerate family)
MIEIRIHGTGGQGVVVAAKLLADAGAKSGYKSQCFSAYGFERRGGNVESYVRISDKDIAIHSKLYEPDYIVLMEENLSKNPQVMSGLKQGGGVLINSSKQPEYFSSLGDYRIVTIDGNAIARKHGLTLATGMPVINTVILGSIVAMIPMVEFDSLSEAIREGKIPLAEKNVEAAREAYDKTKLQRTGTVISEVKEVAEISVTQFPSFKTKMPPCEAGTTHCVAGEDIRTILSLIQRNRFEEAFENIKLENPFPGVCGRICDHPCETHCNRNQYDEGIAIKALERAVFDDADREAVKRPIKRERTGKKVAIIGSGPAGMTCAYFLAILGHDVTVFEAAPVLGGMLRTAISAYLPKEVVDQEIKEIIDLGVKTKINTEIGKDVPTENIINEYDALFLGIGREVSKISFLASTVERVGSLIKVDSLGRTSMPGLYAGGDATSVARTVVEAVGSGKRAAVGIDIWLAGADENIFRTLQKGGRGAISFAKYLNKNYVARESALASFKDLNTAYYRKGSRAQVTELPIEARSSNFDEITSELVKNKAIEEAKRCFQCGQCTLCENCYIFCPAAAIRFDRKGSSLVLMHKSCKKCGICIEECPQGAIGWEVRPR